MPPSGNCLPTPTSRPAAVRSKSRLPIRRVTWARTDGGKQVPAPVDQSMNLLVPAAGTSSDFVFHLSNFNIFDQAPFAALLPQNGGKDPDTGLARLEFNVTVTVFGETLAGDSVSASTTFPLEICFNCGGCSA